MDIFRRKFIERLDGKDIMPLGEFEAAAIGFRFTKKDIGDICRELETDGLIRVEGFRRKRIRLL